MSYERQCNEYRPVFLPIELATAVKPRIVCVCELARRAMYVEHDVEVPSRNHF